MKSIHHRLKDRISLRKAVNRFLYRQDSYLQTSGWFESRRRGFPCRPDGTVLPWMNFVLIDLLEEKLKPEMNLFEFGSGYSTQFFAARVGSITSVEHDREWYERIRGGAPDNARVLLRDLGVKGSYCNSINEQQQRYDVVIVDGRERVNCLRQASRCLSESGVMVLDDSSRARYAAAFEHARSQGFRQLSLAGMSPLKFGSASSTVFYRDNNCFDL